MKESRVSCFVIQDLLPLYIENMLSEDSRALVNEHIDDCEECMTILNEMKSPSNILVDSNTSPFKKVRSSLRKNKVQTILVTIMLSLVIIVTLIFHMTAPDYISYSKDVIKINDIGEGIIIAEFDESVAGYDISHYLSEDGTGYIFDLTTWNNTLNSLTKRSNVKNIVLNPNGENIVAVYYYQTNDTDNVLIYGKEINPNGGIRTLPRLVLGAYVMFALVGTLTLGLICIIFRKKDRVFNVSIKLFFLPVSYLSAHVLVKGFVTNSYVAGQEFLKIIFMMIPLYIAILAVLYVIKKYRYNK